MGGRKWYPVRRFLLLAFLALVLLTLFRVFVVPRLGFQPAIGAVLEFGLLFVILAGLAIDFYRFTLARTAEDLDRITNESRQLRERGRERPRSEGTPENGSGDCAAISEVHLLGESYRNALDEIVRLTAVLEHYQGTQQKPSDSSGAISSRDGDSSPSRYVVGSSRHRMVARLAPNLHWMAATAPLLEFLGSSTAELIAKSFLDVVHADDVTSLREVLREVLRDGEGHNIHFRVYVDRPNESITDRSPASPPPLGQPLSSNRVIRYVQMDVLTCYNEKGAPQHLRCHLLDITDRIHTESALRERGKQLLAANDQLRQINSDLQRLKESYRVLYHHAPVLYFSLDDSGRFVAFNETMLGILGYTREMLFGKPYVTLLPDELASKSSEIPKLFDEASEMESQWKKADGTVIDVWIGSTIVRDELGRFVRSRSAALDITERKTLARALEAKALELQRANGMLRKINQELEDFTYVVSHDLKEPLRTLEAFSNFLLDDYGESLEGEGTEYVTHLIQASRRLSDLIDDLLTLGRVGRVIKGAEPFCWSDALEIVESDLRGLLDEKSAELVVEEPLPTVVGDRDRIIQLLTNLIGNAVKYNNESMPRVCLSCSNVLPTEIGSKGEKLGGQNAALATFVVRDNGIGIDPQYHEQIFRIFRRLHLRDQIEGTGAGLAICKKIVEAHGGRIWVESRVGRGSAFYFSLPLADDQEKFSNHLDAEESCLERPS